MFGCGPAPTDANSIWINVMQIGYGVVVIVVYYVLLCVLWINVYSLLLVKEMNVYSLLFYAKGLEYDHSLFIICVHTNKYLVRCQYLPPHCSKEKKPLVPHCFVTSPSYTFICF